MSVVRPHRFPPLSQLAQGAPLPSTRSGSDQVQWQHAVAEGFQQGFDKGYQEGLSSGQTQGHQAGLANGYEEGRQQGQAAARSEARAQLEGLAAPLDKAAAELTQLLGDYQSALRKEVVELVAKVARQVIRCELALQPTQLLSLVDEALSVMPATPERVDIYLNP
ncbi:MAG TPA: FliH/SctL family protein, partial [Aquabacterium sp.]|nr:FliH/SctL family protein [Aquabacterium sp.]